MRISFLSDNHILPSMHSTDELGLTHKIVLVDLDWITHERFLELRESKKMCIGYITSPKLNGWHRDHRTSVLGYMSGVYAASEYLKNQLATLNHEIGLLPFPVSADIHKPTKKEKKLLVVGEPITVKGKENHAENIEPVLQIFIALKEFGFENAIASNPTAYLLAECWGFIDMSRSSRLPTHFITAGICGCWCFVWSYHAYADKYPIHRFANPEHAVEQIMTCYENSEGKANMDFRKYMSKLHGFSTFEKNLKIIVNKIIFN